MTRKEIVMNMGCSDMSNKNLLHELRKYKDICMVEVDKIILKGIDGPLEKFVAWILGIKKYIPDGWKPDRIEQAEASEQQLNLPLQASPYKGVTYDRMQGRWVVRCQFKKKTHYVGIFPTAREGAIAYNKEAAKFGKPLNVIQEL